MNIVLDTNILVFALWTKSGTTAHLLSSVLNSEHTLCVNAEIIAEYQEVLCRPKFCFTMQEVFGLISFFEYSGISVVPKPLDIPFIDHADKKIYEVAKHCNAHLITGNKKHFPADSIVVSPADFLQVVDG